MITALFNQPNYVGAKKMLDATVLRHDAIARNIANVETPRYRRVDLAPTFQSEFEKAMQSQSAAQIQRVEPGLSIDSKALPVSRDGNTVSLEDELLQLSQNTMQHALETQLVSGALLKMRLAITGKS
jgi:flagellar basal-body rod protein FlgB